ncbi:rhamnosyltransferase [Inquilinus ginsengisoli]|uniref:Rhamnosyltransferase n=1 Tax=Inquilinus ginsengisoli TaxID=363840 RepID=A0ABU1JQ52_9PROT|nr:glycosyltransferase family 2 protein [Inquilinus ginsengisoli]MDR6290453.1 rhamnosyltransferase [Inquilinus ginsengisoli]
MTTLGAVVVLFHPTADQIARVVDLRRHCDDLVVVDNTPKPDNKLEILFEEYDITLIYEGNKNGIAGAHNRGLTSQFERGLDAVALIDQDSVMPENYFPVMREICTTLASQPFMLGPRIFDEVVQEYLPVLESKGIAVRRLDMREDAGMQHCIFLISSGSVISRAAFAKLGPFDEKLFIDHVDIEYCFRARASNVPLYATPALTLSHRIGDLRRHKLGPFEMMTFNHPWYRRYYSARNAVQLFLRYGRRYPIVFMANLLTLREIFYIALLEDAKLAKLTGILLGIVDGLCGRLGPIEHARPRLVARFAHGAGRRGRRG